MRFVFSLMAASALLLGSGCGKKEQPVEEAAPADAAAAAPAAPAAAAEAEPPPPPPIQGAAEVKSALGRKDYPAAVQQLARIKSTLREDQILEFSRLGATARETIAEDAATNPNAAQALAALRVVLSGR